MNIFRLNFTRRSLVLGVLLILLFSAFPLARTPALAQGKWCSNVTIRFFRGLRQVGFTLAGIQPNCTFFARTAFFGFPGGRPKHRPLHLRVVIRSLSNQYLLTNRAPIEHVRLG